MDRIKESNPIIQSVIFLWGLFYAKTIFIFLFVYPSPLSFILFLFSPFFVSFLISILSEF